MLLSQIYHALSSFRPVFSRNKPWVLFCLVVLGFLGSSHIDGVSAFCRFWMLQTPGYMAFLHLFRSEGYRLEALVDCWGTYVLNQELHFQLGGFAILAGDHIYIPKDGRRMPGVCTLHQDSETQTKPTYFRGHRFSFLGLLIGSKLQPFCLPLAAKIHQGFEHLRKKQGKETRSENLGTRMITMGGDWARKHQQKALLVLDAFFSLASTFKRAEQEELSVLVRAKKNYVAFHPAEPPAGKRGRPAKYGEKIKLAEVFEQTDCFEIASAHIYGKTEELAVFAMNLLWKPTKGMLRFIFVYTSHGSMVLMTNNLTLEPVVALEAYCLRIRIETMFDRLKNLIGAFCYRFWSKSLPRHSRRPKKNSTLKRPSKQGLANVKKAWECYERFVMMASISLGILQIIALKYTQIVWSSFQGFLRTRSRGIPSERTVREVVRLQLAKEFFDLASHGKMREFKTYSQEHWGGPKDEVRKVS